MARGLTDKQRTVLEVVERFWRERGMAPSVADVAEAIEVGRSTAYQHLVALKKKGFVDHEEGTGRSWKPTGRLPDEETGPGIRKVPIVAKPPLRKRAALTKDVDGWITVDDGDEELFAVRVTEQLKASSPDIAVGDVVIVARGVAVAAGDIVLAAASKSAASLVRATGPGGPEVIGKVIEVRRNLRGKEAR